MSLMRELRRRARPLAGPLLGLALTGYFSYNLVEGDRGFEAWLRLSRRLTTEQTTLAQVRAAHAALELKVAEMRPDHLDRDLFDERVRAVLNFVGPNEVVIMGAPPPR